MFKFIINYIIFLLLINFSAIAQKDFAFINLENKTPEKFIVIPDSSENICLFYSDFKYYSFSLVNPEGKTIRTKSFKKILSTELYEPYIGASITENAFVLYFANSTAYTKYSAYYISRNDTNDFKVKDLVLPKPNGDVFIRAYTDYRNTYVVTANKKNNKLNFIKLIDEREVKIYSYTINREIYKYIFKDDFTLIKSNLTYTIPLASAPRKMYVNEANKVIYTIDDKEASENEDGPGKTSIIEFDFTNEAMNVYSIPEKNEGFENIYTNSFYYKGKLFRIMLLLDQIGLYIIDVKTGTLEKMYEFDRDTQIELISDKVISNSEGTLLWIEDGDKILTRDSKIFRKLCQGLPSISVRQYRGDTLMLLIGSLNIIERSNGGIMSGISAISASIGPSASTYTTWFNSFLTASGYKIVPDLKSDPEFYKIEKYEKLLNDQQHKISTSVVFRIKGKLYIGYVLKKEKIYKIVEIL